MNKTRQQSGTQRVEHPFPPLYDEQSRILILGSFPSVKSREVSFFYGHKRNRFWKTIAGVLSLDPPETIPEKRRFLHDNHIALWDVIQSCQITGSSDASIKNVVPNDLSDILHKADIRQIFCNGAKSYEYYRKYQEKVTGIRAVKLASTSPANAAYSLERLIEEWTLAGRALGLVPPGLGKSLLSWYDYNARPLPWRADPSPYQVWVSEIMLQQTRVEAVTGYYYRFMERLPSIKDLAEVSDQELMKLWEGLGYYSRARNLKKAAVMVMDSFGGKLPPDKEDLLALPGIGEYTAGAIASIAFGKPEPAVDGNMLRVFSRLLCEEREISKTGVKKDLAREIMRAMDRNRPGDYNQALMDLGATVCIPNGAPHCDRCPLKSFCQAYEKGRQEDFPVKKPKKGRRIERITVLLLEYQNKVAIHKRADQGLLAGLWEFPGLKGHYSMDKMEDLLVRWGLKNYRIEDLKEGKHIFSHVEWLMKGYRVFLEEDPADLAQKEGWIFLDREDLLASYALPSAYAMYRKILERSD